MAVLIFNDFEDVKPYISGAHVTNDPETLEGDFNSALLDKVLPLIGDAAWDAIVASFENYSTNDLDKKALGFARGAIVNLGYYYYGMAGGIQVTNEGLMQANSQERKSAYQWQTIEFRQNKLDQGYLYLGKLLSYFEANKSHFTGWAGSAERTEYSKLFLRDLSVYNRYRKIAGFETLVSLIPYMIRIQDQILPNRITETLFNTIYTAYKAGTISGDNALLIPYMQEYIAHQALNDALLELNFQFTADGLKIWTLKADQKNSREDRAMLEEVNRAKTYLQMAADNAMGKLIEYLNKNATSSKYATYYTEVVQVEAESGNAIENSIQALKEGTSFVL